MFICFLRSSRSARFCHLDYFANQISFSCHLVMYVGLKLSSLKISGFSQFFIVLGKEMGAGKVEISGVKGMTVGKDSSWINLL